MYIISLPCNIFSILNWRGTETDRERQNSSSFTSQQIKGQSVYYIISMIIVPVVANHNPRQCVLSVLPVFRLVVSFSVNPEGVFTG